MQLEKKKNAGIFGQWVTWSMPELNWAHRSFVT